MKEKILERDRHCIYCLKPLCIKTIKVDRYLPHQNDEHNFVASCSNCFENKKGKLPLDFILEKVENEKQASRTKQNFTSNSKI